MYANHLSRSSFVFVLKRLSRLVGFSGSLMGSIADNSGALILALYSSFALNSGPVAHRIRNHNGVSAHGAASVFLPVVEIAMASDGPYVPKLSLRFISDVIAPPDRERAFSAIAASTAGTFPSLTTNGPAFFA